MAKNKVYVMFFLALLAGFAVLCGCAEGAGFDTDADSKGNVTLSNIELSLDKEIAVEIPAVRNQNRQNASGPKIPSGAHSGEFSGIYFIWDSKSNNNGYLFVEGALFNLYESFVLTAKEGNEYWDFFIMPQDEQKTTEDGQYIFFLPRAGGKNNINMVFLSEWTEKEEDPDDTVDPPVIDGELPVIDIQYLRLRSCAGPSYSWKYFVLKSEADAGDYSDILKRAEMEALKDCTTWVGFRPQKYGTQFFEKNNLVMICRGEGSGGNRLQVEKISVTDNELNVTIKRDARGMTCDMAYWYILIPVKKDHFNGETVNVNIVTL